MIVRGLSAAGERFQTLLDPRRNRAMPFGVTWSKGMSIHRAIGSADGNRVEGAGGKFKHRVDLFPRDVELLNDFLDAGSGFKVFKYGGHGHPGIAKHPCATESSGTLSTGRHCDQSRVAMFLLSFHRSFLPWF